MSEQNQDDKQEIICDCTGTTIEKVEQLIKDGYDDLDKISSATGAATGCGSCDYLLEELLQANKKS